MLGEHIGRYPSSTATCSPRPKVGRSVTGTSCAATSSPPSTRPGSPTGFRFHDLRHTCAALLIANGRHLEEVKDYLGHSSIRVTSDRYGHLFPKARAELADALDATFAGGSRGTCPRPIAVQRYRDAAERSRGRLDGPDLHFVGADDGIRTRDPHLGKVMLYQLSHVRVRRRR